MISRPKQRNHFNSKLEHGRVKVNMVREGGGVRADCYLITVIMV